MEKEEYKLSDIKLKISKNMFYKEVIPALNKCNEALKEFKLFLIKKESPELTNSVFKKSMQAEIKQKQEFIQIKWKIKDRKIKTMDKIIENPAKTEQKEEATEDSDLQNKIKNILKQN